MHIVDNVKKRIFSNIVLPQSWMPNCCCRGIKFLPSRQDLVIPISTIETNFQLQKSVERRVVFRYGNCFYKGLFIYKNMKFYFYPVPPFLSLNVYKNIVWCLRRHTEKFPC